MLFLDEYRARRLSRACPRISPRILRSYNRRLMSRFQICRVGEKQLGRQDAAAGNKLYSHMTPIWTPTAKSYVIDIAFLDSQFSMRSGFCDTTVIGPPRPSAISRVTPQNNPHRPPTPPKHPIIDSTIEVIIATNSQLTCSLLDRCNIIRSQLCPASLHYPPALAVLHSTNPLLP